VTSRRRTERHCERAVKRGLDLAVASVTLVVLSPVWLLIGCVVLATMGRPILFRQTRLGYEGRPFVLYKFRTMTGARDESGDLLPDAERLTRLGRFLRRTTLDSLPELFNVLRGDLSIVGPRPLLPEYRDRYTPEQWRRHEVPPGMAGPVLAEGRNALSWDEKFGWDVWYVDNWSLRLDMKIFARGVWKALKGEGVRAPGHATMPRFELEEGTAPSAINVLFTSAGRRVELLRAFRQAYADLSLAGSIVAIDADPLAASLQVADRTHVVPRIENPAYVSTLVEICRRENVGAIFPLIDPEIPLLATHRSELEGFGARVVVIPDAAVAIARDKALTYEFFQRSGIPSPRTWTAEEIVGTDPELPLFVKSRFGSAGEHAVKVNYQRELSFFLEHVPDPIVQEFLSGPEITNDVVCDLSGNVLAVVSRQRIEVRQGEVAKGKTIHDPRIIDYCVTIAKGLEAIGPITVQCILKDGEPYFTEINPRFAGGIPLSIAAGVPAPHWFLALFAGLPIQPPPLGTYQAGLVLTRFDDSFILAGGAEHGAARDRI
jgi:carbamoyl-phosphate synthase large subunit